MSPPGQPISFGARLSALVQSSPSAIAVRVLAPDAAVRELTWRELDTGAIRWGRALAAAGAHAGDRVAIELSNSPDLVLAALGSWKIGAVPVPVRWDLPDWERSRVLDVIAPTVTVGGPAYEQLAATAPTLSGEPLPDVVSPQVNGICSSGSTGTPKVILNHRPALWLPEVSEPILSAWQKVALPQHILVPAPFYHTNGFVSLTYLLRGDQLTVLEKFDAALILDAIERFGISFFMATPTMLARIAARPDVGERDLSSVAWIMQGAAPMPDSLLLRWFELLAPEKFVMAYGMTENLGMTLIRGDEWLTHPGSVGRGAHGTEIKILDSDHVEVAAGQSGDVYLRSPLAGSYRYLGDAPALPRTPDGFVCGGDIGRLDASGYLYLIDRRTDMIVTGGANVYPAEVELALSDHPLILDVVVLGLADPHWGRRVHAVVQVDPERGDLSADEVIAYAKTRLASYKAPKSVEFVPAIPRTAATKVNRRLMSQARGG